MRLSPGLSRSMLSVGSAMFLGDVTCQQIEQYSSSVATENDYYLHLGFAATTWNVSRSVRMGCTGLLLSGPISHVTYVAVAKSSIQSVYMKTLAIVAVAPINISCSISTPSVLAGLPWEQVVAKWKKEIGKTFALNSLFWPMPLFAIQAKVKLRNRGSVGAVVWFGWSILLSVIANRGCHTYTRSEMLYMLRFYIFTYCTYSNTLFKN